MVIFAIAVDSRFEETPDPPSKSGLATQLDRVGIPPMADVVQVLKAGVDFGSEALRWYRQWGRRAAGRTGRSAEASSLGGVEMGETMGIRLPLAVEADADGATTTADAVDEGDGAIAAVDEPAAEGEQASGTARESAKRELSEAGSGHSYVLSGGMQVVGAGEDPRLVWHAGRFYVYLQQLVSRAHGQAQVEISVVDLTSSKRTVLVPPERTPSEVAPHGKNWAPFSWGGKLHFVYLFEPLRVLRCDDLETSPCLCSWVLPNATAPQERGDRAESSAGDVSSGATAHDEFSTAAVGIFRGGSAGVSVPDAYGGSYVVGLGHVTFTEYR